MMITISSSRPKDDGIDVAADDESPGRHHGRRGSIGPTPNRTLLTLTCGPEGNLVRFIPAHVVTESAIEADLQRFEAAVGAVPAIAGV